MLIRNHRFRESERERGGTGKWKWTGLRGMCIPTNLRFGFWNPIKSKVVTKVNLLKHSWIMLLYPFDCVILDYILPRSDHKHIQTAVSWCWPHSVMVEAKSITKAYVTTERLQNLDNFWRAVWAPGIGWIPDLKYGVLKNSWTRISAAEQKGIDFWPVHWPSWNINELY